MHNGIVIQSIVCFALHEDCLTSQRDVQHVLKRAVRQDLGQNPQMLVLLLRQPLQDRHVRHGPDANVPRRAQLRRTGARPLAAERLHRPLVQVDPLDEVVASVSDEEVVVPGCEGEALRIVEPGRLLFSKN